MCRTSPPQPPPALPAWSSTLWTDIRLPPRSPRGARVTAVTARLAVSSFPSVVEEVSYPRRVPAVLTLITFTPVVSPALTEAQIAASLLSLFSFDSKKFLVCSLRRQFGTQTWFLVSLSSSYGS